MMLYNESVEILDGYLSLKCIWNYERSHEVEDEPL